MIHIPKDDTSDIFVPTATSPAYWRNEDGEWEMLAHPNATVDADTRRMLDEMERSVNSS